MYLLFIIIKSCYKYVSKFVFRSLGPYRISSPLDPKVVRRPYRVVFSRLEGK